MEGASCEMAIQDDQRDMKYTSTEPIKGNHDEDKPHSNVHVEALIGSYWHKDLDISQRRGFS
jgi:hypothetical protein